MSLLLDVLIEGILQVNIQRNDVLNQVILTL